MIFGNRKAALKLYNAINHSNYQNPEDLEITTIEGAIYMGVKNDLSFLIDSVMNLYEAQSTRNPNMPLRGLIYFARVYQGYVEKRELDLYSGSRIKIPLPRYIVFYNGSEEEPDRREYRLSDAFEKKQDSYCLECVATVLNINAGHNRQLMEDCSLLWQYASFVSKVRRYLEMYPEDLEGAVDRAVEECIAEGILADTKQYRQELEERAGFTAPMAKVLAKSAGQFVSRRESTDGKTILAGYPFFEDWGRDTMIALPGVCISTGQYETAKEILRTFAVHEKDGLMPNLFPEGKNEPRYNTVDAALLFINCVYLYYQAAGDLDFVKEVWPVMERIVANYQAGTRHGIRMDEDGLILAGEGLDQVTWMDVRVGDLLPTPRHGKPVEVNAYWYNALRIMEMFASELGMEYTGYGVLSDKVRTSFRQQFWNEEKGCLKDLISGTKADTQIRCNQIWAVSMPFGMMDEEQERQVVRTVYEKLYTPYGLRTLEEADEEFHPFYGGEMIKRDLAYHQGTVWVFPLGAYYLAYLKVHGYSEEARQHVRKQLEVMESAMREGCIGQLPEIYDGGNPTSSKGCFAQAWSVGEILRVYEAVE